MLVIIATPVQFTFDHTPAGTAVAEAKTEVQKGPYWNYDVTVTAHIVDADSGQARAEVVDPFIFYWNSQQIFSTQDIDYAAYGADSFFYSVHVYQSAFGSVSAEAEFELRIADVMDQRSGTPQNDVITGDRGMDKILGGAGSDRLFGLAGNDTLYGGSGKDNLSGGTGSDAFVFKATKESPTAGLDVIIGWEHRPGGANRDRIDLSQIDANSKVSGSQSFDWIGTKKFSGHSGELRYEKKTSYSIVLADVDGDKKADFAIKFDHSVTLYEDDFLF